MANFYESRTYLPDGMDPGDINASAWRIETLRCNGRTWAEARAS